VYARLYQHQFADERSKAQGTAVPEAPAMLPVNGAGHDIPAAADTHAAAS
jgi:hypothetical protein